MEERRLRAVVLARVSTDRKGREAQDPEQQVGPLVEAARRLGWEVAEVLRLRVSAWDEAGEAGVREAALRPIREGRADVLMVWAWDRLSRGGIEAAFGLLRELEDHNGGTLYSLTEPFLSTATASKEVRGLLLAFAAWNAERESARKSERVRKAYDLKVRRVANLGEHGDRPLWGRGRAVTPEVEAKVRAAGVQGKSVRAVAAETGIPRATVHRILSKGTD